MGVFREAIYGVSFDNGRKEGRIERREEIVRCRDCENYTTDELGGYCTLLDFEDANGMEDKFCAWGVRRVS